MSERSLDAYGGALPLLCPEALWRAKLSGSSLGILIFTSLVWPVLGLNLLLVSDQVQRQKSEGDVWLWSIIGTSETAVGLLMSVGKLCCLARGKIIHNFAIVLVTDHQLIIDYCRVKS